MAPDRPTLPASALGTPLLRTQVIVVTSVQHGYSCSQWLSPILMLLYLARCSPHHPDTWSGLSCAAALSPSGVAEFLRLGLPGVLSMSEWWFWEFCSLVAGYLGNVALAAHVATLGPSLSLLEPTTTSVEQLNCS